MSVILIVFIRVVTIVGFHLSQFLGSNGSFVGGRFTEPGVLQRFLCRDTLVRVIDEDLLEEVDKLAIKL